MWLQVLIPGQRSNCGSAAPAPPLWLCRGWAPLFQTPSKLQSGSRKVLPKDAKCYCLRQWHWIMQFQLQQHIRSDCNLFPSFCFPASSWLRQMTCQCVHSCQSGAETTDYKKNLMHNIWYVWVELLFAILMYDLMHFKKLHARQEFHKK